MNKSTSRLLWFISGVLLLLATEILRVYFIMPFPGSQRAETIALAYFLHNHLAYFRLAGIVLLVPPALYFVHSGSTAIKLGAGLALFIVAAVFYFFNYHMLAEKMFYQPRHKIFATAAANKIPTSNLVLGVTRNGEAKAYPLELIGYHHQVRDTIGGAPVMITYCTVCRTGRVFNPIFEGKLETFRLVGMDHFNAMFEDATTKSWWRQVNGEAIVGPRAGKILEELPSEQMRLAAWLEQYPHALIMQGDSTFQAEYDDLQNYDEGKGASSLTRTDSLSWQEKSWIVGVQLGTQARAYDWRELLARRVLNDTLNGIPLAVVVENDSASFHVWQRDTLTLRYDAAQQAWQDEQTFSTWNGKGESVAGPLQGRRLQVIQSYQEFWHSWRTFRPHTTRYEAAKL